MSYRAPLVRAATAALAHPVARGAALGIAAALGHGLVLVYHRVAKGPAAHEVVRSLPTDLFRQQVDALARVGDIVPLAHLQEPARPRQRPRFAITFDDDHVGYIQHALPVLQAAGVPATFFLSGRALHDLPPYWWTFLEESVRSEGLGRTARALGLDAATPGDLARACESSAAIARLMTVLPASQEPPMLGGDIRALADAGMTIGFHTLHHPIMSELSHAGLEDALRVGRRELAEAAGTEVNVLAYPHGRASHRVAEAAERAAFRAAFVTGGHPITGRSHPFLLGRWEPGPLAPDEFIAAVTLRLLRTPTPRRSVARASNA